MIVTILKKYIPRILRSMHREFKVSVEKQKKYLKKFAEPQNDLERAYYQYKCQQIFWGKIFSFAASCAAFVLFPVQYQKLKKKVLRNKEFEYENCSLILVADEMPEGIFPEKLIKEFDKYKKVGAMDGFYFDKTDVLLFEKLKKKYWYSPYFLYKCLMKQAGYSYIIHKYNPKAIAACGAECTYTSSYLTFYCKQKKVEHYDVMHGEMFFYILDAFSHFDRFYVWDKYYEKLLRSLRVNSEFIIAQPESIKMNFDVVDVADLKKYEYKYYLQMQDGIELKNIAESMQKLKKMGYTVCVRYHPRTINLTEIKSLFKGIDLENPRKVPIEKSIKTAKKVVGLNSTVLFQAYTSGRTVVIDDVSNPWMYEKLKELQYILIKRNCALLSAQLR